MWRPVAKDGADLPGRQRTLTPARLTIAVGETYGLRGAAGRDRRPEPRGGASGQQIPPEITPSGKAVELRAASAVAVTIPVPNTEPRKFTLFSMTSEAW
jgi:hypothetical protein